MDVLKVIALAILSLMVYSLILYKILYSMQDKKLSKRNKELVEELYKRSSGYNIVEIGWLDWLYMIGGYVSHSTHMENFIFLPFCIIDRRCNNIYYINRDIVKYYDYYTLHHEPVVTQCEEFLTRRGEF